MNLVCIGKARPVVVLDAGAGDWSPSWIRIQRRLASRATVCAYDRAGYGFSEASSAPRTSARIADELHALLHAAKLPPPYVLVGHSFGGLNVQAFTERYRGEVAGLVLVDGTADDVAMPAAVQSLMNGQVAALRRCASGARDGTFDRDPPVFARCFAMVWGIGSQPDNGVDPQLTAAVEKQARRAAPYETLISETANVPESQRDVREHERSLGDLPLIVLTATTHGEDEMPAPLRDALRSFEPAWRTSHERIAALSTNGRFDLVTSGHYIQFDRPDVVIRAINIVLSEVKPASP